VVVRIPASKDTHRASCRALREYYKDEPAYDHFEDEARVCYESFDPGIYYNPDSKVFTDLFKEPARLQTYQPQEVISDYDTIYENLKTWLIGRKLEKYEDGNKHKFLVKLAAACNRFGINQYVALSKMKNDFMNLAGEVDEADYDKIVSKVYNLYSDKHAIAQFDVTNTAFEQETAANGKPATYKVLTDESFEVSFTAKDIIYLDDIKSRMVEGFTHGYSKGTTTYFNQIDFCWKWKKGEVTLMGGIMNHGKSSLMLQLMLLKSVAEGTKWAVFSPEQNPPDDFYNDLIHTYIGKTTVKGYANQMSMDEYEQGMDFIKDHFYYLYPEEDAPTPEYINSRFLECIIKHKVEGCMIDPFNQLDHDWNKHGRDDRYLSVFLGDEKKFALKHNVYKIIVAHPKGDIEKIKDKNAYNYSNYECPDMYDLAGGAMWGNKCDNILMTYRPFYSTDKTKTDVEFRSQKIKKQKLVGIPGNVTLTFDRGSNRYLENGVSPLEKWMPIKPNKPALPIYNSYHSPAMQKHIANLDWDNPNGPF
jgi:twinkle protein